jgi:two-component system CheB/CheR fusion protein
MKSPKKLPTKKAAIKKAEADKTDSSIPSQFPIVGIGASAGGLEALEQFLGSMRMDSGMAFVVVQHLDPDQKGMMPELLQRITKMKVIPVTDRLQVEPNNVYVIPPNKSMSILNRALHLFERIDTGALQLPVDVFFRSLAHDQQGHSIGIILSGMGSDGTLGLKAIKERSGIVLVQDPKTAKFDSMPRNAIDAVLVDIVASASELPGKLLNITKTILSKSEPTVLEADTSSLEKIIILLRSQTENDFSQYKKNTMYRRIERRMGVHQIDKIESYVRYLQENTVEVEILFKELLIGVTSFFRDVAVWEHLKNKVLPAMFADLPHGHVLRAWIPGCSTGEEAYSWAIIFKEAYENVKPNKNLTLQIFATDLDENAIEQARRGIYQDNIVSDVSDERLNRFFVKTGEKYRVNAEVREMVVFAPQNVIKHPPFTKLDILSCRNMLIYMDSSLQKKLLSLFHYSLNHKGILLLGSAETNGDKKELLSTIDSKLRIYQGTGTPKSEELFNFPSSFAETKRSAREVQGAVKTPNNVQMLTDNLLLQQFSPASVLVTNQGDILYLTGNTGKYLTPAAGTASMNIFTMAREGLRNELPVAFRKATQNYQKLVLYNVKVGTNGGTLLVDVTIQQIEYPLDLKGKIMVVFTDAPIESRKKATAKNERDTTLGLQPELEREIQRLGEELQTTHEEMQTSQEELKSTNEELQSSNEELQSTNEELTTSKEEMQSLNEELHTVNAELMNKVNDSVRVTNDMNNLLNSSEIATLFLDKKLNIRQFTIHATKILKLIDNDIGRPYTDLANNLNYPEMLNDAKEVLGTLMFVEKTISTTDCLYYTVRIMPYRTLDDKIEGLVITFIDITKSKKMELELLEGNKYHHLLLEHLTSAICYCKVIYENDKAIDFVFIDVNQAFYDQTGLSNVKGKKESDVVPSIQESDPQMLEISGRVASTGNPEQFEYFVSALGKWFSCALYSPSPGYFISINEDITKQKEASKLLEEAGSNQKK